MTKLELITIILERFPEIKEDASGKYFKLEIDFSTAISKAMFEVDPVLALEVINFEVKQQIEEYLKTVQGQTNQVRNKFREQLKNG